MNHAQRSRSIIVSLKTRRAYHRRSCLDGGIEGVNVEIPDENRENTDRVPTGGGRSAARFGLAVENDGDRTL